MVNNPVDWSMSYCLPVMVVSYGPTDAPAFISPAPIAKEGEASDDDSDEEEDSVMGGRDEAKSWSDYGDAEAEDSTAWKAPFRWHWQKDDGKMEPYTDLVNEGLERQHDLWKHAGGPHLALTPPITRYVDDIPQVYEVDFRTNRQRHTRTNYVRSVSRLPVPVPSASVWTYMDEHGQWRRFDSYVQATIETGFQAYVAGHGQRVIAVQFPGRPERYEVNFATGMQRNMISGTERPVTRR